MTWWIASYIFIFTSLFFVGVHNVDLMMNGCMWASVSGIDCSEITDTNTFLTWSLIDGYRNGLTLMVGSFFLLMSFLVFRLSKIEKQFNNLRLLHNEKVEK